MSVQYYVNNILVILFVLKVTCVLTVQNLVIVDGVLYVVSGILMHCNGASGRTISSVIMYSCMY